MPKKSRRLTVKIDGKDMPLNPFVQRIIGKTVLAMLSTLKSIDVHGDEIIEIVVRRAT